MFEWHIIRLLRYVKGYKHYTYMVPWCYLLHTVAILVFLHPLRWMLCWCFKLATMYDPSFGTHSRIYCDSEYVILFKIFLFSYFSPYIWDIMHYSFIFCVYMSLTVFILMPIGYGIMSKTYSIWSKKNSHLVMNNDLSFMFLVHVSTFNGHHQGCTTNSVKDMHV